MESENTLVIAAKAPVKVMLEAGKDYVCYGCGKSKSQPFCKHSHRAACIAPLKFSSEVRVRSGGILTDFTHAANCIGDDLHVALDNLADHFNMDGRVVVLACACGHDD